MTAKFSKRIKQKLSINRIVSYSHIKAQFTPAIYILAILQLFTPALSSR